MADFVRDYKCLVRDQTQTNLMKQRINFSIQSDTSISNFCSEVARRFDYEENTFFLVWEKPSKTHTTEDVILDAQLAQNLAELGLTGRRNNFVVREKDGRPPVTINKRVRTFLGDDDENHDYDDYGDDDDGENHDYNDDDENHDYDDYDDDENHDYDDYDDDDDDDGEKVEALDALQKRYDRKSEEAALLCSQKAELLALSEGYLKRAKRAEDSLQLCNETESELRRINSTLQRSIREGGNTLAELQERYAEQGQKVVQLNEEKNQWERNENTLTERISHLEELSEEKEKNLQELREFEDALQIVPKDIEMSDVRLGAGSYGEVVVGNWRGCAVAVKSFYEVLDSDYHLRVFRQEISVLSRLRHPNITAICGIVFIDGRPKKIVTHLLEASLSDVIKAGRLSLREKIDLAVGFTSGISFLHQLQQPMPILHGDIRPSNVLVTRVMEAQVCDLGTARFIESSLSAGMHSPDYSAPERIEGGEHSSMKADVYSLGVTLIELMIQQRPIRNERRGHVEMIGYPGVKSLCSRMIGRDPSSRFSAPVCLKKLTEVCHSVGYKMSPPKRMVKGKQHGNKSVELPDRPWC